ncbi:Uncharacterized protein ESCO_005528 [Escovopsis weberi]|uniref:PhoD-like phosphatase domain-containing protein n=1 Tax=Escovopsis weberi TaxID=150374 RepID=A0A0M9VUZ7_ESCWE|nr:Uncharacterized protein ESCO_005528 [Escovopsis weberi]
MPSRQGDAAHPDIVGQDNPYASASTWRHQESSKYARHAARMHDQARGPTAVGEDTADLADFANGSCLDQPANGRNGAHQALSQAASREQHSLDHGPSDGKDVVCGPLLNYRRTEQGQWVGSVLVVVRGGGKHVVHQPTLVLQRAGEAALLASRATTVTNIDDEDDNTPDDGTLLGRVSQIEGQRLYSDPRYTFWVFDIRVPIEASEIKYEYALPQMRFSGQHKPRLNSFFVPAADESMRIMFHSCNGFSVGTDEKAWSGQALWNDVLRKHKAVPFHAMIGGGDQIYNDGIRVNGPLQTWTAIGNPKKRQEYPFPDTLRAECDDYYLNNYLRWFNTGPFSIANGQIPQINIWDDHDIIDGFGSYVDKFMRCDVFRGIGGIAHKYYMLFQHHLPPPPSTYTSDHSPDNVDAVDPNQLIDTYVAPLRVESQYIEGHRPGPYVSEHSFNIYTRLVNYPETYELVFERVRAELATAASWGQPIKHLILLLGIPIAYPRLTWLENILRSPFIGPIKFMNRRFGVGGGLFNHFDGSVDLLDDLDDHYTARTHKTERCDLVESLQAIAAEFSVRITILGGDVHLAALGRFYSNPKLKIPAEEDNRYMVNVISSAIVNKPPPQGVANLLARRNKIHHLNCDTDETLLDLFDKDPGDSSKTANHNHCTMPSRNFAMLTENSPNRGGPQNGAPAETNAEARSFAGNDGHHELHNGEVGAGTTHRAATDGHGKWNDGSLDVRINVEIDQHNPEGLTEGIDRAGC